MEFCNGYDKLKRRESGRQQDISTIAMTEAAGKWGNPKKIRYLSFMPWSGRDSETEKDHGYYYKQINSSVKLISGLLEENGFKANKFSSSYSYFKKTITYIKSQQIAGRFKKHS